MITNNDLQEAIKAVEETDFKTDKILCGFELPKKHTKNYGVYFRYNGRNVRALVGEFDSFGEALKYIQNHYKYEDGKATVTISNSRNISDFVQSV